MLGYYAYGIMYYWWSFALYEHGVSSFRCFRLFSAPSRGASKPIGFTCLEILRQSLNLPTLQFLKQILSHFCSPKLPPYYLRQRSWGGIAFTPVCLFVCLFVFEQLPDHSFCCGVMKFSGISCYVKIWKWFIFERSRSKVKVEQTVKFI